MDGQQQFLKPAQHVPFYVKRPITLDTSSHPHIFGFENGGGKPASYSVDFAHTRFGRPRHTDQISEPVSKTQSKSLRDVFEKAILSGDVPIHSPEEDTGVIRNPSFITASLPRPEKFHKHKPKSATIGGDNYIHVGKNHHRSTDYFIDSDSESDTDNGRHNDAYLDDASSTISDELFKSNSEGPADHQAEEDFNIQPLPHVLDIDSHQPGRSTLGGLFKPKYRDYPHNNVHRTSERQHKEVIDCGTSRHSSKRGNPPHKANSMHRDEVLHRDGASLSSHNGKLPRTKYPNFSQPAEYSSQSREASHSPEMSHNKYLPKKRRSSRSRSPRPHSPRQETAFNELEDIVPASPELPRRISRPSLHSGDGRVGRDGNPLEQMDVDEAPWIKAEIRERRRRKRRQMCIGFSAAGIILLIAGAAVGLYFVISKDTGEVVGDTGNPKVAFNNTPTSPKTTTSTPTPSATPPITENITLTFDGRMRVTSENFTRELNNLNSPRSKNLSDEFCNTMEGVFDADAQDADYRYQQCKVTNFSEGSTVVHFTLIFRSSWNTTINTTILLAAIKEGAFCEEDSNYTKSSCRFEYNSLTLDPVVTDQSTVSAADTTTTTATTATTTATTAVTTTATTADTTTAAATTAAGNTATTAADTTAAATTTADTATTATTATTTTAATTTADTTTTATTTADTTTTTAATTTATATTTAATTTADTTTTAATTAAVTATAVTAITTTAVITTATTIAAITNAATTPTTTSVTIPTTDIPATAPFTTGLTTTAGTSPAAITTLTPVTATPPSVTAATPTFTSIIETTAATAPDLSTSSIFAIPTSASIFTTATTTAATTTATSTTTAATMTTAVATTILSTFNPATTTALITARTDLGAPSVTSTTATATTGISTLSVTPSPVTMSRTSSTASPSIPRKTETDNPLTDKASTRTVAENTGTRAATSSGMKKTALTTRRHTFSSSRSSHAAMSTQQFTTQNGSWWLSTATVPVQSTPDLIMTTRMNCKGKGKHLRCVTPLTAKCFLRQDKCHCCCIRKEQICPSAVTESSQI